LEQVRSKVSLQLLAQFEHQSARFAAQEIEQAVELKVSQPLEIESGKGISDPIFLRRQPAGRYIDVVESSGQEKKLQWVDCVAPDGAFVNGIHNCRVVTHDCDMLAFP
jgi:hypothetical protein